MNDAGSPITYHRSKKKIFKTYNTDWAREENNIALYWYHFPFKCQSHFSFDYCRLNPRLYLWKTHVEDEESEEAESPIMARERYIQSFPNKFIPNFPVNFFSTRQPEKK